MSATPFTRRKFLISTAAAASSAWFLAACGSDGGSAPAAAPSASTVPQSDIDKALDTETTLTFWTWVPDITERGQAVHHQVPEDQGERGQRRPGRPALPEAADRNPVRAGRPGRGPGRVPVHQLLHAGRRKPARLDPLRPGGAEGQLPGLGLVPGQHQRRPVGDPAGHRSDGPALSRRPAQRGRHRARRRPTTNSLQQLRRTTPRIPRATW